MIRLRNHEEKALFVHFNDLRLCDNGPLRQAQASHKIVYSAVIIDTELISRTAFGIHREGARRLQWRLHAIGTSENPIKPLAET